MADQVFFTKITQPEFWRKKWKKQEALEDLNGINF